jgi:hypothetical protein
VGLADKLLELHMVEDLVGENGIDIVQCFLEKELGSKKIDKLLETWKSFALYGICQGEGGVGFQARL